MGKMPMPHRRSGFSLAEVLIATGILGVGLLRLIGIFPAAIEQNKDSTGDVLGTIICENAMSLAKVELKHPLGAYAPVTFDTGRLLLDPNSGDTRYPTGDPNLSRGFIMMARQPDATRNDYQFAVISYLKNSSANNVSARSITIAAADPNYPFFDGNSMSFSAASSNWLKIGSPVIDPQGRGFATIIGVSGSTVYLNHPVIPGGAGQNIGPVIVVAETDPATGNPVFSASPATCVLITRTGLRQ
jgi:prepilin-type N-terminal cleavage/methylation domain-containing protein